MIEPPLITVIIPSYERSDYLQRAVESALTQQGVSTEILIIDDHSSTPVTDRHSFPQDNVEVIRHELNKGVSAARNTGIAEANGEYIAFLDDDDYWKSTKLRNQLAALQDGDERLSYTWTKTINTDGEAISKAKPDITGDLTTNLLKKNKISISSVVVDSTLFKDIGSFDTTLSCWEDWEWLIRASTMTGFTVVKRFETIHQRGEQHRQRSKNLQKKVEGHNEFLEKINGIFSGQDNLIRICHSSAKLTMGKYALSNRHSQMAIRYFYESVRIKPDLVAGYLYIFISLFGNRPYHIIRTIKRKIT